MVLCTRVFYNLVFMPSKIVHTQIDKLAAQNLPNASGKFVNRAGKQRKHVLLDQPRLKKAQELLGAKTESETIERALESVITNHETDKNVWAAHERFIKGLVKEDAEILDVFGRLDD